MTSGPRHHRALRAAAVPLAVLLGLNLLLRLVAALRPLAQIDGLLIPDDAYLSLTLARNIARGLGPLYGAEFTNGFQPLYVFLMVPFFRLWPADPVLPVHAALAFLAFCDTLALFLLYRLLRLWTHSRLAPLLAMAAWVFSPCILQTTLNGLETMLSCCLILGALCFFHGRLWGRPAPPPARHAFTLGFLLGLAAFARIDNLILAFTLVLVLADGFKRELPALWACLKTVALIALGGAAALGPWLLYSRHYTGDLYPVSGRAVRFMTLANTNHLPTFSGWYLPMMIRGFMAIVAPNGLVIALGLLLLGAVLARGGRAARRELRARLKPLLPVLFFAALLYLAYTLYIFGDWYFSRYLFPLVIPLLSGLAVLADLALARITRPARRRLLALGLLAAVTLGQAALPQFRKVFTGSGGRELGYMNVGLWARRQFKPGTAIGSSQTGALGYFADTLKVFNLDGVVSKSCLRSLVERRHFDYIRQCGIEYVLGSESNIAFLRAHSDNDNYRNLIYLNNVDGLRSWGFPWGLYKVN